MWMHLVYLKLELKRACRRLPHLYAGAIMLLLLAGVIALLAGRMLYGDQVVGKVAVGVSVPEEDALARQVMKMVSSLESVNSICDFHYMDREACLDRLEDGELYAVLDIPEGFVQDIMNGVNTPVKVWLTEHAGIEGKLFRELTDAGAVILSAGQAGIYGGNELYYAMGLEEAVGELEDELNRRYMDYSLQRTVYFRHRKAAATGDVTVTEFYEASMYVLFLFLSAIPVSGYLLPMKSVTVQKLRMRGIGSGYQAWARISGMGFLMAAATGPVLILVTGTGAVEAGLILAAVWIVTCMTAASVVVFLYQLAGTLMGGIMLLFLVITGQHFLAGGFLPAVFLPVTIRKIGPWLPSGILMDTVKTATTRQWSWRCGICCLILTGAAWTGSMAVEVKRR